MPNGMDFMLKAMGFDPEMLKKMSSEFLQTFKQMNERLQRIEDALNIPRSPDAQPTEDKKLNG